MLCPHILYKLFVFIILLDILNDLRHPMYNQLLQEFDELSLDHNHGGRHRDCTKIR